MAFSPSPPPFAKMRPMAFAPRRPSTILRYIVPSCIILLCFYYFSSPAQFLKPGYADISGWRGSGHGAPNSWLHTGNKGVGIHPIDTLVGIAEKDFADLLNSESHSLNDAAAAYRDRRGRHPPPGFDEWYQFAKERNAVMIESFWDQIYHDLEPFWAIPAPSIRKQAWDFEMTISIRDHNATAQSDWFWTQIWLSMIKTIEHLLPDMDIALNAMDEPRMVVPWEQINKHMAAAEKTRAMQAALQVVTDFQKLPSPGEGPERKEKTEDKEWEKTKPYWLVARRGCNPESLSRKAEVMTNFNSTPIVSHGLANPHMYQGYVANYTMSTDFCHQPDLQGLDGIFVEPLSVSATKVLFPMFGGSKLAVNNEILLPAPVYWKQDEKFTGGGDAGVPWEKKKDMVVWRGVATGGRNRDNNWKAFQRHRFVALNNATKLSRAESWTELPNNFAMPPSVYGLHAQGAGRLGDWVDTWANVSFVDLMCEPRMEDGNCNYTGPYFAVTGGMKMAEQFNYKYLPDIDGNSFSGRYLGFLKSTSLPIKSTLWREWHDARLVAWKHFVPMDNRYSDWHGIMEYFLGYGEDVLGHDVVAERIAMDGKAWADMVLRREDMQIYVYRLLLEYARISDERREKMGWVQDLLSGKKSA